MNENIIKAIAAKFPKSEQHKEAVKDFFTIRGLWNRKQVGDSMLESAYIRAIKA